MEANEEFTATTLERLQQARGAWYRVGYEHGQVAIDGNRQPVRIRATHSYRPEQDEWKLVHRHGDPAPVDDRPSIPTTNSGRQR
jgi:ketosteroid isomerase-like protein